MHKQEPEDKDIPQIDIDEEAYKLLIVEDNIELLMLMSQILGSKYHVHTATNGKEALDIIHRTELDIIISDVMMPVMNGLELTHRLKSDPNFKHLPIILLTAKTQEEDRNEALQIGADSYVTKPFKVSDLELRINNLIENRKRIQREALSESLGELSKPVVPHEPTPEELFLKKAVECVHAHLDDSDYDRDQFAADMGVSTSTLYNKLRSLTGLSVSYFIRDIRLKEAKSIMERQPSVRISELAYRVGFRDPKYFATCFKKEYGVQPSEYVETQVYSSGVYIVYADNGKYVKKVIVK
jgi:CheY-like chemotaxis protein